MTSVETNSQRSLLIALGALSHPCYFGPAMVVGHQVRGGRQAPRAWRDPKAPRAVFAWVLQTEKPFIRIPYQCKKELLID